MEMINQRENVNLPKKVLVVFHPFLKKWNSFRAGNNKASVYWRSFIWELIFYIADFVAESVFNLLSWSAASNSRSLPWPWNEMNKRISRIPDFPISLAVLHSSGFEEFTIFQPLHCKLFPDVFFTYICSLGNFNQSYSFNIIDMWWQFSNIF